MSRFALRGSELSAGLPPSMRCTTNHNVSVDLGDSVLAYVYDSLRYDGTATVVTVYETDADSVVGLWQMGRGSNRALWLNSREVSHRGVSVPYRTANEKGVVIHTMPYRYPAAGGAYGGCDTLYLGCDGRHIGDKKLCEMLYYPGVLAEVDRRRLESALAIRYGALLHSPYVDSRQDTLWDPCGGDSAYSATVCGVGRDDSVSLLQERSAARGDLLTVAFAGASDDRCHVMLGSDGGGLGPTADEFVVDGLRYNPMERRWRLRAHTCGRPVAVRLGAALPFPAGSVRLLLCADGDTLLPSSSSDSLAFGPVTLADGRDYTLTLLMRPITVPFDGESTPRVADALSGRDEIGSLGDSLHVAVSPNPTAGGYTVAVDRPGEGMVDLRVVDARGRVIDRHREAVEGSFRYDGWLRERGVHYIQVACNGRSRTVKLMVTP